MIVEKRPLTPGEREAGLTIMPCEDLTPKEIERIYHPLDGQEKEIEEARRKCGGCALRAECLDAALNAGKKAAYGFWGGATKREREAMIRQRYLSERAETNPLAIPALQIAKATIASYEAATLAARQERDTADAPPRKGNVTDTLPKEGSIAIATSATVSLPAEVGASSAGPVKNMSTRVRRPKSARVSPRVRPGLASPAVKAHIAAMVASFATEVEQLPADEPEWRSHKVCRDDDETFNVGSHSWTMDQERVIAAKFICKRCPVLDQCATDAYESADIKHVRGGMTPPQRHNLGMWPVRKAA